MAKRLVVACGSGVATSTTIAEKIKQRFENDNISCNVEAVDYKSIMNELPSTDIYVYIAKPDEDVLATAEKLGVKMHDNIFTGNQYFWENHTTETFLERGTAFLEDETDWYDAEVSWFTLDSILGDGRYEE